MDSNRGSLVSEATALPTEAQLLHRSNQYVSSAIIDAPKAFLRLFNGHYILHQFLFYFAKFGHTTFKPFLYHIWFQTCVFKSLV